MPVTNGPTPIPNPSDPDSVFDSFRSLVPHPKVIYETALHYADLDRLSRKRGYGDYGEYLLGVDLGTV